MPRDADPGAARSLTTWVRQGLGWRRQVLQARIAHLLGAATKGEEQWCRIVMDRETARFISSLDVPALHALEISGAKWKDYGFASYRSVQYPEYDICARPLDERYDLIIAEQVLEHVLWPYRAVRHMRQMLRPGGTLVLTTPFLLRIHNSPQDCSRWTELGLKYLLAEAGFELANIVTGAWGNRACVRANFRTWRRWNPMIHSLRNEALFPVVVWAFAKA